MRARVIAALALAIVGSSIADRSAVADPPTDASSIRYEFCSTLTGPGVLGVTDAMICRKCAKEAMATTPVTASLVDASAPCRQHYVALRDEYALLIGKLDAMQPAGYQGAGAGLEVFPDADLDAAPATADAAILRINAISLEMGGPVVFSPDKRIAALTEIKGFVATERACRSNKKCTAAREAKKAEQEFFDTTVSPMCVADKDREAALADIATERANPGGAVDLSLLHDLGRRVQDDERQIKEAAPAYVKFRHHAWRGWRPECQ